MIDLIHGTPDGTADIGFQPLESRIGTLMTIYKLTFAAAESCTGGLVLHRMTNIAGSSAYVLGGFVTYSNEAKIKFAGVNPETLRQHGAVSQETAAEMARGARLAFGADVAMSVTGIAGPGGGTPTKPVGLVYIAVSGVLSEQVKEFHWQGDREGNKRLSAEAGLQMLHDYLRTWIGTRPLTPPSSTPIGGS